MSAWRMLRDHPLSARVATPADRATLSALLAGTWRRHGNQSIEDQAALLSTGTSTIAFSGTEAVGFLGIELRAPAGYPTETWADLSLVAAEAGRRGDQALSAALEVTLPELRCRQCTGVVCLVPPGWLQDGLRRAGFEAEDQVITYALEPRRMPVDSGGPARLVPANTEDAPVILSINALAFPPLWRYDEAVIMTWLITADRAAIAEIDGAPAAFALTTEGVAGNYAHLIRIATAPAFQGRGIGRQLVEDAIRYAYEHDTQGLALNTQASNSVSRRLYESLGFRQTGHTLAVMTVRLQA